MDTASSCPRSFVLVVATLASLLRWASGCDGQNGEKRIGEGQLTCRLFSRCEQWRRGRKRARGGRYGRGTAGYLGEKSGHGGRTGRAMSAMGSMDWQIMNT